MTTAYTEDLARRHTAIRVLRLAGLKAPEIADVLTRADIPPRSGGRWSADSINHICARLGLKLGGRP